MKRMLSLAAAGLLMAGAAQAGTLTVANSDIVLYGFQLLMIGRVQTMLHLILVTMEITIVSMFQHLQ